MRKAFSDQFEAFARRGAGWGTRIPSKDAEGKPTTITVSKSWFFRQLLANPQGAIAQPRADKGVAYRYLPPKVRTRDADGNPLTYSGQTRVLVTA